MEERVKCCAQVTFGVNDHFPQCSRWSVVSRDGKPYCWQHDPVAKEAGCKAGKWNKPLVCRETLAKDSKLVIDPDGWITGPEHTLSRVTAIKLVEAAVNILSVNSTANQDALGFAAGAAKRELGV